MRKRSVFGKIFTGALVLSLLLATAACGGKGNESKPSESTTASPSASTPAGSQSRPDVKPVEIVAWDKPNPDDVDKDYREQKYKDFEAAFPNIKVTHVMQTKGKEREQFLTAVAGGEQPDLINVAYPSMEAYIQQGILADITDLWNQYPDKGNYLPGSLATVTANGRIYGVPMNMYTTGLYYNKKIFKDAGLDPGKPPATWDEFVGAAKKTTDAAKGINGFDILGMDWADWHFEYYVWAAGGDLTTKRDDGSVELNFTSDATVAALQFYKDLKWTHRVTQKNVVQGFEDNLKDFYTGRAAMIVGASDHFGQFIAKGLDPADIGFMPFPAGPSGSAPAQVGGSNYVFSSKSSPEKLQAAFTYATWLTSKETMQKDLQFYKDNGTLTNLLVVRSDIDLQKYITDLPADIAEGIAKASANPHLEYFLKDRLSPYIVKPIQTILLDQKADPLTELKKAQDLAQKEVADKYNADLKK